MHGLGLLLANISNFPMGGFNIHRLNIYISILSDVVYIYEMKHVLVRHLPLYSPFSNTFLFRGSNRNIAVSGV